MDNADNIVLLLRTERHVFWEPVPFFQTPPTAGCRRVLSDKYGMPAHGRLFAVVCGMRWRKALGDEISGMLIDSLSPFVPTILPLFRP